MYALSIKSLSRLVGVHPDLIKVVRRAIDLTSVDFGVLEGVRTPARQAELFAEGKSKTLHSRHITGHAVDLIAMPQGKVSWDMPHYSAINAAMQQAAGELQIPVEWGGGWRTFTDGPHFQLPWREYPVEGVSRRGSIP